jgi:hypothetical protein
MKKYEVTFINENGETIVRIVEARHEFEAVQVAQAFDKFVVSVIDLDQ